VKKVLEHQLHVKFSHLYIYQYCSVLCNGTAQITCLSWSTLLMIRTGVHGRCSRLCSSKGQVEFITRESWNVTGKVKYCGKILEVQTLVLQVVTPRAPRRAFTLDGV